MPAWLYFAFCLAAALAAIAMLSALLARQRRWRELRRVQGLRMLDALERYGEWLGMQRHNPQFGGESAEAAEALDEACTLRIAWFPELAGDMAQLLAVHNRLVHFLTSQQALRQTDTEAWLESDHDGRFMALCRQQALAMRAMRGKLGLADTAEAMPAAPATYAKVGSG